MKILKNENGFTMILILVLALVVLVICTSLFTLLISEIKSNKYLEQREITTYVAHSGLEHALSILENDSEVSVPTRFYKLFEDVNKNLIGEYKIIELDESRIVCVARLRENVEVINEIQIEAQISEDGVVTILE